MRPPNLPTGWTLRGRVKWTRNDKSPYVGQRAGFRFPGTSRPILGGMRVFR